MSKCEFVRRKPKNVKSKREVEKKESLIKENPKQTLYMTHEKCSSVNKEVMKTISEFQNSQYQVKLPFREAVHPFEDQHEIESSAFKLDASLFCTGISTKKRPHGVVIGRMHNFKVLDMVELGAYDVRETEGALSEIGLGSKPALIFLGQEFEYPIFKRLQNLFVDFFGGPVIEHCHQNGFDRALCVSIKVLKELESYDIPFDKNMINFPENAVAIQIAHLPMKSGNRKSISADQQIGFLELILRRASYEPTKSFNLACKQIQPSKQKGISYDELGNVKAQVHVGQQDVVGMARRRFKRDVNNEDAQIIAALDEEPIERRKKAKLTIPDTADI